MRNIEVFGEDLIFENLKNELQKSNYGICPICNKIYHKDCFSTISTLDTKDSILTICDNCNNKYTFKVVEEKRYYFNYSTSNKNLKKYYKQYMPNVDDNKYIEFKIFKNRIFRKYSPEYEFDEIKINDVITEINRIEKYIDYSQKDKFIEFKQLINNL